MKKMKYNIMSVILLASYYLCPQLSFAQKFVSLSSGIEQDLKNKTLYESAESVSENLLNDFTLFQNVSTYSYASGGGSIEGEIYCPEDASYTFNFSFMGIGKFQVFMGGNGNPVLRPNVGESAIQQHTVDLQAGTNKFIITLDFSEQDQQASCRLVVDKINGNSIGIEEGYVDLVMAAVSLLWNTEHSVLVHWVCGSNSCNTINMDGAQNCVSCSAPRGAS